MLEIKNLKVLRDAKEIIKGINLNVKPGEVHAIMGPNGSGKSTLSLGLTGFSGVELSTGSKVILDGVDITNFGISERVHKGLFLAFQNPVEVPGVSYLEFLRLAYNNMNAKQIGESFKRLSPFKFKRLVSERLIELGLSEDFLSRNLNEGFSGGEKKKSEILQLLMLKPKYAILDEIDSGLDITALKLVADVVNKIIRENNTGFIIITHYNRILEYIKPQYVHVLIDGQIVETGGANLAVEIEKNGYDKR